jgi:hypothetical protein
MVTVAAVTVPCMIGLAPSHVVSGVRAAVRITLGVQLDVSSVNTKLDWLAARPTLGVVALVVAVVAGLATFPGLRRHDGMLLTSWLSGSVATLCGRGRLLLVIMAVLLLIASAASLLDRYRWADRVAFMRYPLWMTARRPFVLLVSPLGWVARAATGQVDSDVVPLPGWPSYPGSSKSAWNLVPLPLPLPLPSPVRSPYGLLPTQYSELGYGAGPQPPPPNPFS